MQIREFLPAYIIKNHTSVFGFEIDNLLQIKDVNVYV